MDLFENLGLALRWIRSRQSRSQMEVAHAASVTKAMLSAYETGKQAPSIHTLGKVLRALGADLHQLQDALDLQQGIELPPFVRRDPAGPHGPS